jgi:hypothetical protein
MKGRAGGVLNCGVKDGMLAVGWTAHSARSFRVADRRSVPASWSARAGQDHRAYAAAASRSANRAGCAMCGKCPLSAQTSTVACGAVPLNQAAVSGDGSEPRISVGLGFVRLATGIPARRRPEISHVAWVDGWRGLR